jgi:hypothetical protein
LVEVLNRLEVGKDVFDDSRNILNDLKKIALTEQERFCCSRQNIMCPREINSVGMDNA